MYGFFSDLIVNIGYISKKWEYQFNFYKTSLNTNIGHDFSLHKAIPTDDYIGYLEVINKKPFVLKVFINGKSAAIYQFGRDIPEIVLKSHKTGISRRMIK